MAMGKDSQIDRIKVGRLKIKLVDKEIAFNRYSQGRGLIGDKEQIGSSMSCRG
jgi:hypothetical protein